MEKELHIIIKRAKISFDNPGKEKTLVLIQLDDEVIRTPVVIGGDPAWHFKCKFTVNGPNKVLFVRFMKDSFFTQDLLGYFTLEMDLVHFKQKEGVGKWYKFLLNEEESPYELLMDVRYALPTGLNEEEAAELSRKLSFLNNVLDEEVETITKQQRRIIQAPPVLTAIRQSIIIDEVSEDENDDQEQPNTQNHTDEADSRQVEAPDTRQEETVVDEIEKYVSNLSNDSSALELSLGDDEPFQSSEHMEEMNEEEHNAMLMKYFPPDRRTSAHNSDSEADKDMKIAEQQQVPLQSRIQSRISARRNWHKALEDIKKARESGVYSTVVNKSAEATARDRVKSILLEPTPSRRSDRTETGEPMTSESTRESSNEPCPPSSELVPPPSAIEAIKRSKFQRRLGFRDTSSRRRQSNGTFLKAQRIIGDYNR